MLTHPPHIFRYCVMSRKREEQPLTHPSWEWLEQNRGKVVWFDFTPVEVEDWKELEVEAEWAEFEHCFADMEGWFDTPIIGENE